MTIRSLIRLSGLSLILGGITLFVHYATHPQGESAPYVAMPLWIPSHVLGFVAWSLILMGLVGLYLRQAEKAGLFGFLAFVFAFVSGMASGGGGLWGGAVFQVLYPNAGDPGGPLFTSPGARLVVDLLGIWILAFVLFALSTLRARVLPRAGAWLVMPAALMAVLAVALFPFGSPVQYYIADVASAILGLGLIMWGYALWSGVGERSVQPASAVKFPRGV